MELVFMYTQEKTPLTKIVKVEYTDFTRYWCFGEKYVVDVYDINEGKIEQNEYTAFVFDDMTVEELVSSDAGKYAIQVFAGKDAVEQYAKLVANCN